MWVLIQKEKCIRLVPLVSRHTVGSAGSNNICIPDPQFPALHGQFLHDGEGFIYSDFEQGIRLSIVYGQEYRWSSWICIVADLQRHLSDRADIILDALKLVLKKTSCVEEILSRISREWLQCLSVPAILEEFVRLHIKELACESPVEVLLEQSDITDILVEGHDCIWVEKSGQLEHSSLQFTSQSSYLIYIENLLSQAHKNIDESSPFADFTLSNGARAHVIGPPVTLGQYYLSIRKTRLETWSLDDLYRMNMLASPLLADLRQAVQSRANILISGATGSGKTTLLRSILNEIPEDQRVVTIEDSVELKMPRSNSSFLYTRHDSKRTLPDISIRDLLKQSLRMRPDRIVIGEVRGEEAMDLLHAMNTGHRGCLASIHANSTRDALFRLQGLVRMSSASLSEPLVQEWIGKNIQLLLHCGRGSKGERKILESAWVRGLDGPRILLEVQQHEV